VRSLRGERERLAKVQETLRSARERELEVVVERNNLEIAKLSKFINIFLFIFLLMLVRLGL